jgi:hypothetical protein
MSYDLYFDRAKPLAAEEFFVLDLEMVPAAPNAG